MVDARKVDAKQVDHYAEQNRTDIEKKMPYRPNIKQERY